MQSYLVRVLVSDAPGSLGRLAGSVGSVGGSIQSVDIVHQFDDNTVMDDIVIALPDDALSDTLVTAAQQDGNAVVDSIRPFSGSVDRRGQIRMLASVAADPNPRHALENLASAMPKTMTASWAIVLKVTDGQVERISASAAAPGEDSTPSTMNVGSTRLLNPESERDSWVPETWTLMDTVVAASPIPGTDYVVVIGRHGGPDFLASEISHLGDVATIVGAGLDRF
ncbi:MAG: amino acid-binding ACT domain protein [Corynebacterium sp.]|nr:amino acid-binding ACT domain protein [Corynebacterium sp.]